MECLNCDVMWQNICNIDLGEDVSPIFYSHVHSNSIASSHNVWFLLFCFLFKLVFVFRKKFKTVFESDHKNTPSIAMSFWFRTVILILDAFKAAWSSNHGMVTNLFFLGASLDFPMIKLHDVEFWYTTLMYAAVP